MEKRIERLMRVLKRSPSLAGAVVHERYVESRPALYGETSYPLGDVLIAAMNRLGIQRLFSHQAEALDWLHRERDVVVTTPTASGKSLIYFLPILESVLAGHGATAVCLYPFKALARDQLGKLEKLAAALDLDPTGTAAAYDGDTSTYHRKKIRGRPPAVLMTNPDMLHTGILPYHDKWADFFARLKWIVIDELHVYRGIFGSHVSWILRRLLRLARHYGASPRCIACSATISNAGSLMAELTGRDPAVVTSSGAPQPGMQFVIMDPAESLLGMAIDLFSLCVNEEFRTIAFTKARKITELLYTSAVQRVGHRSDRISAYRAGFLPSERREIEQRLFEGSLHGVISTSALEVGIDVGGLDCCILVGYPGTVVSTLQRTGRVGRGADDAAAFMLTAEDALDKYIATHPDLLFTGGFESVHVQPDNGRIMHDHLLCAAAELALDDQLDDLIPAARAGIDLLTHAGELLEGVDDQALHPLIPDPHRQVSIRGVGEEYVIVREQSGKGVGSLSGIRAFHEGHQGAVYLHHGQQYLVTRMDLDRRLIIVEPVSVDYYTQTHSDKETFILEIDRTVEHGLFAVSTGRVKVVERITEFVRKRIFTGDNVGRFPLELPPLAFETNGAWMQVSDKVRAALEARGLHYMGSLHAFEHAALAIFPLISICDRYDLRGISFAFHPQLKRGAVFLYDNIPEGLGIARQAQDSFQELLGKVYEVVSNCPCDHGCPRCIYSPRCGAGNRTLDKQGAIALLEYLLGKRTVTEETVAMSLPVLTPPEQAPESSPSPAVLVFDLETRYAAQEVGGWNKIHLMKLAIGVVYDLYKQRR
ncbi:DEAD/DEAH box helicase, partial [bacterium]|nr:DEAD/DEAH box helicase [candidate division CSSED10-310 bacterium]